MNEYRISSNINEWLSLLRDPLNTRKTLNCLPFSGVANFSPFKGREWGVLVSETGTMFPYCGSLVFFEKTPEVAAVFDRTRAELSLRGMSSTCALVGDDSSSAIDRGDGLFSSDQIASYDKTIVEPPFWQALERRVFAAWQNHMPHPSAGVILDLGCGTGRCLEEYTERGFRMIGVDASYSMLCAAASAPRVSGGCLLVLCSATRLPLRDEGIAGSTCFGTLHHLAKPELAFDELHRVFQPGAALLALEPNRSPLRFLFDAVTSVYPLWEEEAGEGRLLSRRDLLRATSGQWDWDFDYSVFVLPQLLYLLGNPDWIGKAIEVSDRLRHLPLIRSLGGMMLLTARKTMGPM